MIKWLIHIGLGRLVAVLRRKGYLTDTEAVQATEAVETLTEIGLSEAAKPHGESEEQIGAEAVADYMRTHDPDRSADSLNALEARKSH